MVKPNYNFAKRQRELAKKAKKEEKQQRKAATGNAGEGEAVESDDPVEVPAEDKPAA
ncbi:MAG: hypothetical protein ABI583_14405 [Betaproteobacteria bacterium]